MPCGCQSRMVRLLRWLGFERPTTEGWQRRTARGRVVLDIDPRHHSRLTLLALVARCIQ